ncbi:MAG: hypothetical protein ACPG21_03645 [Crocinitomicaceae bacterium]
MTKGSLLDLKRNDSLNVQGYYFNLVTKFEYGNFNHLDATVNEKEHEGSIQLDANDSILYFYRDENVWWVPSIKRKVLKLKKWAVMLIPFTMNRQSFLATIEPNCLWSLTDPVVMGV